MNKDILLIIATLVFLLAGFVLALMAYVNKSFTLLVFSIGAFFCSAYYATVLDDRNNNGGSPAY